MNTEAHLAAGWVLAHCGGPHETRRFRAVVVIAALAPDLDVLSYVFGERAYATYHHAVGHNLFFGALVSLICPAFFSGWRQRWKVLLFTQLAFWSHFLGDYFFTRFPLEAFWPFSHKGYVYSYRIGLDHPINTFFSYFSFVIFLATALMYGRTPLELLSPELDQRVVNLLKPRRHRCHLCGRGANEACASCGRSVCLRHGRITAGFRVRCSHCAEAASRAEVN